MRAYKEKEFIEKYREKLNKLEKEKNKNVNG